MVFQLQMLYRVEYDGKMSMNFEFVRI
jgi:hypothetical protein